MAQGQTNRSIKNIRKSKKKKHEWDIVEYWGKASYGSNGSGTTGYPYEEKKKNLDLYLTPFLKVNTK